MSKRVDITPQIEQWIKLSIGDPEADVSKFVVFESRSLSTEAIKQRGFHNGARLNASVLNEMASYLNTAGNSIPLQIMHDTSVLPVGRVFRGSVSEMDNGETELRTMFYLPADKEQLIKDIEASVIDEVSVNVLTEHAFCSECSFDFFGEDAFMNRVTLTCGEGHEIGTDGVHVRLTGFSSWAELSLVNRGAAKGAKILPRSRQSMSEDTMKKLAASGTSNVPVEARLFYSTYKLENKGDLPMDAKELIAALSAKGEEAAGFKIELANSKASNEALTAANTKLAADLATVTTEFAEFKKTAANSAEVTAAIDAAKLSETKMKEASDKLLPHVKAALVASGVAETDLSEKSITDMVTMIEEKGLKLHQIVAAGSVTDGGKDDDKLKAAKLAEGYRSEAFKTIKS